MNDNVQGRTTSLLVDILVACAFASFLYRHIVSFIGTGRILFVVVVIFQVITICMFLFRNRKDVIISRDPYHYFVAFVGTSLVLFLQPAPYGDSLISDAFVFFGVLIQIGGLVSLNRSFGIVPANRTIKQKGLYAVVRHPMYSGYILMVFGYVLSNMNFYNAIISLLATGFFVLRIYAEEEILMKDETYKKYSTRVPWRLIPFVF